MIIEKYNTFFFHVPKVAGYAIEQFLIPGPRDYKIFDEDILFGVHKGVMTQHLTYSESLKYRPKKIIDSFFKFAFFRNPWDRFSSAYFYLEPHYINTYKSFDNFVEKICEKVHSYTTTNGWHFAKQTDWIFDHEGNIILDFIGRYEYFDMDFKKVCELIGAEYKPLQKLNKSKNSQINYRDMYTDKTKQLIKEAYKVEIEFFDYKF